MRAQRLVSEVDARLGLHGRLVIWLFALLLLSRFSILGAALTVVVVSGQVFLGSRMIERYGALRALPALSRIGISFCVGATVSTFIYIAIVTFSNRWLAILGQVGLLVCVWRLRRVSFRGQAVAASSEEKLAVKWIVVVTLLGLSPDWFWPLPVAIVLALSIFVFDRVRGKSIAVRVFGAAACGAVAFFVWLRVLDTRPIRPWFADDRFAEIFSFSLGRWGVSHNPMMMGETISYHWFSFAWVGALANMANESIEIMLAQFGPMIIGFGCAILGYSISRSLVSRPSTAIVAVSLAVVVDTERLFRGFGFHAFQLSSFSQFFSLALGLAILLLIIELRSEDLNSIFLVVGVIFAGLIGAKSSSGLVALFGLGGLWLYWVVSKRSLRGTFKFLMGAVIVPTIFAVVFFFGDPRNGSSSVIRRPGWPAGVSRDLWDVYNGNFIRYLPILIFLTLALCGLAVLSLAVIFVFSKTNLRSINALIFLALSSVAAFLQMWIAQAFYGLKDVVGESDNTLYAPQFIVSLCVIFASAISFQQITSTPQFKLVQKSYWFIALLSAVIVLLSRAWKIEFTPSYLIPFLTSLKPAIPFFASLALGVAFTLFFRQSSSAGVSSGKLIKFLTYSMVAIFVSGVFISSANYIAVSSRQQAEWRTNDQSYAPSDDLSAATSWINETSESSDIVATRVTLISPAVSKLANRKEFAGFWATNRLASLNSPRDSERRQILFDFTSSGDCESAEGLRANEVAYVLVDLTNPDTPDVERCAEEAFRNETVIVYSLK